MLCCRSKLQPLLCGTQTACRAHEGCDQAAIMAQHCVCQALLEEFKPPIMGRIPATPCDWQMSSKHTCSDWKKVKVISKMKTYLRYYRLVKTRQPAAPLWWWASTYCRQESPKEEKVGVKRSALLNHRTTPLLQTVSTQIALLFPSLVFLRAGPSLNAVLCRDFLRFQLQSGCSIWGPPDWFASSL